MADPVLQMGIVVGYLLVALAIGLVAYRLTDRTAEDYYLAGRSLGTVVLLFTMFATLLSAFTFFAGPNISYQFGPEWILVMGLMDGVIFGVLWYVLGYKQWLVGNRHGYVTVGEMLGDRFGSRYLRALIAGISLFWLFPYVMLQQIGAGTALEALTAGAVPFWGGAALVTVFMIVYVVLAGMRGVAWTDTLQGAFMLVMIWAAFLWVVASVDGVAAATAQMGEADPEFLALGGGFYSPQRILSFAISIAFGVAMFPQVNQRFFAGDSETVLKRSLVLWPVLVLLLFVPAFLLGAWAKGLGIEAAIGEGQNVLPLLLVEYTPGWFAALVIAGAIAAMMSSSDSMLLSGSSYFTRDLYGPLVDPDVSDDREDLLGRVGVVLFATAALVASLIVGSEVSIGIVGDVLLDIGDTAFGGFAQMTLPVLIALYWSRTTRAGMYAGILASQVVYVAGVLLPVAEVALPVVGTVPLGVPATYLGWGISLYCILLGVVLTVGVSLVTTAAPTARADRFTDLGGVDSRDSD
jgi:SSS family solute:Na+ symporter